MLYSMDMRDVMKREQPRESRRRRETQRMRGHKRTSAADRINQTTPPHAVLKMTEQIKAISERWKALDEEARRPYLEKAAADKQRYLKEKEAFTAVR